MTLYCVPEQVKECSIACQRVLVPGSRYQGDISYKWERAIGSKNDVNSYSKMLKWLRVLVCVDHSGLQGCLVNVVKLLFFYVVDSNL